MGPSGRWGEPRAVCAARRWTPAPSLEQAMLLTEKGALMREAGVTAPRGKQRRACSYPQSGNTGFVLGSGWDLRMDWAGLNPHLW